MTLTPDEKKRIAGRMEWKMFCDGGVLNWVECRHDNDHCIECEFYHPFSLNDAGLCVAELVKQGKLTDFLVYIMNTFSQCEVDGIIKFFFTADSGEAYNFFRAMSEWIKSIKGE